MKKKAQLPNNITKKNINQSKMKKLIKIIKINMEYTKEQLKKFHKQIEAYENGEKIEFLFEGRWYEANKPSFDLSLDYRIAK